MKYRISKRLGAYSVAGVLLANNVPVFANNTITSETVSMVDEEQVDVKEPEGEGEQSSF